MADQQDSKELAARCSSRDNPLIPKTSSRWSVLAIRYRNTRKCVNSKAALLILFWSFTVGLANRIVANPDTYMQVFPVTSTLIAYGIAAFVLMFYPLAGFLADVKFGRYKTALTSLYLILPFFIIVCLFGGAAIVLVVLMHFYDIFESIVPFITVATLAALACIVLLVGFAGFTANVVQFGMDQLHASPGEYRTLFIHWYVWVYSVSVFIAQLAWNVSVVINQLAWNVSVVITQLAWNSLLLLMITPVVVLSVVTALLIVSVCLGHRRRRWFLIEPGRVNPYRLVYRVSKFAYKHRIPVNRSAFTFCEDEIPSGLDLGKDKYGGPFTTEEVEDVKVFYGILKVLFSFGMVFFLDFGANSIRPLFAYQYNYYHHFEIIISEILLHNGVLSPLLVTVCIPLYLFLIRPFISYYIPGMLKRMGIGMCLMFLSLILSFSIVTIYYKRNDVCPQQSVNFTVFNEGLSMINGRSSISYVFAAAQNVVSAFSNMLIYIAVFEFICSQSPHSMKGLLIGLWYAIKGLYQMIAAVSLAILSSFWSQMSPLSCVLPFYLMNIFLGIVAMLLYVCIARRYKYRERDEPCHVRRYAEEYYSNIQQDKYKYYNFKEL